MARQPKGDAVCGHGEERRRDHESSVEERPPPGQVEFDLVEDRPGKGAVAGHVSCPSGATRMASLRSRCAGDVWLAFAVADRDACGIPSLSGLGTDESTPYNRESSARGSVLLMRESP
jgi:hypothetical protein